VFSTQWLDRMPDAMGVRRQTVEHSFVTFKSWMGGTHFLERNKPRRGHQRMVPQATDRSDRGRRARIPGRRPTVRHPTRNDYEQADRFMPCGSATPVGD
jgi:hypothetical protein